MQSKSAKLKVARFLPNGEDDDSDDEVIDERRQSMIAAEAARRGTLKSSVSSQNIRGSVDSETADLGGGRTGFIQAESWHRLFTNVGSNGM